MQLEEFKSNRVDCLIKNNNFIKITSIRNKPKPSKNIESQYYEYIQLFGVKHKEAHYRTINPSLLKNRACFLNVAPIKLQLPYLNEIVPALLKNSTLLLNFMKNYDPSPLFVKYPQKNGEQNNKRVFNDNESHSSLLNNKLDQQISLSDIQKSMIKQLDLSQIIKKQFLLEDTRIKINKKFILFLTGKYRALKQFNLIDQSENLSSDVCKCVRDLMEIQQVNQEFNNISRKNSIKYAAGQSFINQKILIQSNQTSINLDKCQLSENIKQISQSLSSDINDASLNIENEENYSNKKQFYQQNYDNENFDKNLTHSLISQMGLQNLQSQSEKNSLLSVRMTNQTNNHNNQTNNSYQELKDCKIKKNNFDNQQCSQEINLQNENKNDTKDLKSKKSLKIQKLNEKKQKSDLNNEKNVLFSESSSINTEQNNSIKEGLQKNNSNQKKRDSFKLLEDSQDFSNLNDRQQDTKEKRKQIFHNLSKYLMHFILELLSEDHIDQFDLISGYKQVLLKVIQLLKQSGKRNKLSQTYYFNHSHYNCIFLTITSDNINKLKNNQEFYKSHKNVFEDIDFDDRTSILNVNIIKTVVGNLVILQLDYIIHLIESELDSNLFEISNINSDCQAKINYLKSVSEGIKKLLLGNNLIRF